MEEINSMVRDKKKKLVAEEGKKRKTEGTNREKRDPWQGSGKESHAGVRICLLLSSAVRWQALAQSVCLGSLCLAPLLPCQSLPSSIYWELARSRILRS